MKRKDFFKSLIGLAAAPQIAKSLATVEPVVANPIDLFDRILDEAPKDLVWDRSLLSVRQEHLSCKVIVEGCDKALRELQELDAKLSATNKQLKAAKL